MEIRVLQYFLAIAREQNISKAAEVLHITQPTLSRQIKELEDTLGKQLFIRGNRKITLTEEGMFFKQRAEEIVSLAEKTQMEMMASNIDLSGDIYIGCAETKVMSVIAKVMKDVTDTYPNIKFHLSSGNASDVFDKIDKGLLEFGILVNTHSLEKYDYIKLPAGDRWGVLMPKSSPLASYYEITVNDLKDKPLIMSTQNIENNEIAKWLGGDIQKFNIVATYNLSYNATFLVKEGMGYCLCLDKYADMIDKSLVFKPITPMVDVEVTFVWKKYHTLTKAASYFLSKLQEAVEPNE